MREGKKENAAGESKSCPHLIDHRVKVIATTNYTSTYFFPSCIAFPINNCTPEPHLIPLWSQSGEFLQETRVQTKDGEVKKRTKTKTSDRLTLFKRPVFPLGVGQLLTYL